MIINLLGSGYKVNFYKVKDPEELLTKGALEVQGLDELAGKKDCICLTEDVENI